MLLLALIACAPRATAPVDSSPPVADASDGADGAADGASDGADGGADGATLLTARLPGASAPTTLLLDGGVLVALDPEEAPDDATRIDHSDRWLAPAFLDSHVHLAYLPEAEAMLDGGVVAAVDLAAPLDALSTPALSAEGALRVRWAGPMVTAVGGYPTQSWGRNGYGLEVTTAEEAAAAVATLADAGATLVKVPLGGSPGLTDAALEAAVAAAHDRGLPVAAHALDDAAAARAAAFDVDLLAHLPTRRLRAATIEAWAGRAVVPTLDAFGPSADALANLADLQAAGAVILYGTDFGNTRTAGVQEGELRALVDAGMTAAQILAAGTAAPAAYWGWDDLGSLEPGKAASFLVLAADPLTDPLTLADPVEVWVDGARR